MTEGKRAASLTENCPRKQRADEADAYCRRAETVCFSTTAVPIKAEARKTAKLRSAWTASLLPVNRDA
jgi:hypothetical protein